MLNKKSFVFCQIIVCALFAPISYVHAYDFSYSYVEAGILDFDGGDGFALRGSYEVKPSVFIQAEFLQGDLDDTDITASLLSGIVGVNKELSAKTDGVFSIGFGKAKASVDDLEVSDTGFVLAAGVRYMFTDKIEATGFLVHQSMFESETNFEFGGRYHIDKTYSIGATLSTDDSDTLTVTGRINF